MSLYEDVMRSMDAALRQQHGVTLRSMPAAPLRRPSPTTTLVMEAVHRPSPASMATRVVEVDPSQIEGPCPESELVTIQRPSPLTVRDPESTILLVTIEELEAEARGPATERIPRFWSPPSFAPATDRTSGVELVHGWPHAAPAPVPSSTPPPPLPAIAPAIAPPTPANRRMRIGIAPVAPKRSRTTLWVAVTLLLVVGLAVLVGAGAYAVRARRGHATSAPSAPHGSVASTTSTTPTAAETASVAAPAPSAPSSTNDAKPDDRPSRGGASKKVATTKKKTTAKRATPPSAPTASNEAEPEPIEDPTTLLAKAIEPATEL